MLHRLEKSESPVMLDDFKRAIGMAGRSDRDSELTTLIESATANVEDVSGTPLRAMTLEYSNTTPSQLIELPFAPILEIVSLTDARTGEDVSYRLWANKTAIEMTSVRNLNIQYKVVGITDNEQYKQAIIRLGSLVFDGISDQEALRQVYNMIPKSSL